MFHLGWFAFEGIQGWSNGTFDPSYDWASPLLHQKMAQALEQACFDFVLIEDASAISDEYGGNSDIYLRNALGTPKFDPAVMATYMAAATEKLGIIPTLTTSFYPPFILSRLTATLSHMSKGRVGWNLVTSSSDLAARNFSSEGLPEHDKRYDIADEYFELCTRLWQSWEADAVVLDHERGIFADPQKVHRLDFNGEYYQCRGPLNVPQPPGGKPVIAQAGNSPRGKDFAAQHADIVLTPVIYPPAAKAFRDDIRALALGHGRNPDDIKVMCLAFPRVFANQAEVDAYKESLNQVPDTLIDHWLALISSITGIDLSQFPRDEPLPSHIQTNGSRGTLDWLRSGNATVKQMALRMARMMPDDPLVGTAEQVADEMEAIMAHIGGDGLLIAGSLSPSNVHSITQLLVPALQRKGLVRRQYSHTALRDNLLAF